MSSASAAARASFRSTRTTSRPTPRITRAYAAVEPTSPLPTIPTFMRHPSLFGTAGSWPALVGHAPRAVFVAARGACPTRLDYHTDPTVALRRGAGHDPPGLLDDRVEVRLALE